MSKKYKFKNLEKVELNNDLEAKGQDVDDFDSGWENTSEEMKVVSTCGRKPEGPLNILFSRLAKSKIDFLMAKFPSCEWLAYLIGDAQTRYVRDISIPTQEVSSGAVNNVGPKPEGTIGVIHSHHSMGAFFSGTDDAYINQNNDISVVIAHRGIKAQVRWVTPCGYKVVSEGAVIVESESLFNENEFEGHIDKVVSTTTYATTFPKTPTVFPATSNIKKEPYNPVIRNKRDADLIRSIGGFNKINVSKYTKGFVKGLSIGSTAEVDEEETNESLEDLLTTNFRNNR
jgi:hypothetical protein